jgi:hypothetical protein
MKQVTKRSWTKAYPNFVYASPSITLKESFTTLKIDQFEASTSGETP